LTLPLAATLPLFVSGIARLAFLPSVSVSGVGPLADLNASNGALLTPIPLTLVG
jgi:hypothetical protein